MLIEPMVTYPTKEGIRRAFADRMVKCCRDRGITRKSEQAKFLAKTFDLTQEGAAKWLEGTYPWDRIPEIAAVLNKNLLWMSYGLGPPEGPDWNFPELRRLCRFYLDLPQERQRWHFDDIRNEALDFRRIVAELAPRYAADPKSSEDRYDGEERRRGERRRQVVHSPSIERRRAERRARVL